MPHINYLKEFKTLNQENFSKLMRHLGFASSAVYRLKDNYFVLVLKASDQEEWPAAIKSFNDYTSDNGQILHQGWFGADARAAVGLTWLKEWPKGTHFYLPDQELEVDRLMFTVSVPSGKRLKGSELSGPLEALAGRMRHIYRSLATANDIVSSGISAFNRSMGADIRTMMDHELRTPLASVAGYLNYIRDMDPREDPVQWRQYWDIIASETKVALEAVDRLSLAVGQIDDKEPAEIIDLMIEVSEIVEAAHQRAHEIVGEENSKQISIKFRKFVDGECFISAQPLAFRWAVWEVLKNAISFSKSGSVDISLYLVDQMVVLDIEDDGQGVIPGSEELIFMRFFQDMRTIQNRKGRRGLGLGLFLARRIALKHFGQLNYIRQKSSSLFRFVWPLHRVVSGTDDNTKPHWRKMA